MFDSLTLSSPWMWLTAGLLLMLAELAVPGFYLIWIGGAALLTGLIAFTGMSGAMQMVVFALLTVVSILVARRWFNTYPIVSSDPLLNDRAARMVGEMAVVVAMDGGSGRVRVGDSEWVARGPDLPTGPRVRIVSVDSSGHVTVDLP